MSLQSILVLVIIFVLLGRAMKKGGCCGSGCTGNCASCQEHCNDKQKKNPPKQQ